MLLKRFSQTSQQGVPELCGLQQEGSGRSVYLAEEGIYSDGNRQQGDTDFSDRAAIELGDSSALKEGR